MSPMGTFPPGFFDRVEPGQPDQPGLDDVALAALRDLYDDLGIDGARARPRRTGSPEHFNVPAGRAVTTAERPPLPFADAASTTRSASRAWPA